MSTASPGRARPGSAGRASWEGPRGRCRRSSRNGWAARSGRCRRGRRFRRRRTCRRGCAWNATAVRRPANLHVIDESSIVLSRVGSVLRFEVGKCKECRIQCCQVCKNIRPPKLLIVLRALCLPFRWVECIERTRVTEERLDHPQLWVVVRTLMTVSTRYAQAVERRRFYRRRLR